MPRAGPLRYWSLSLLGALLMLGSAAGFLWGLYEVVQTGTCASGGPYVSARPCPDDTWMHVMAIVLSPWLGILGMIVWALRGAGAKPWYVTRILQRRERRLADRIARGEVAAPTVAAPPRTTPASDLPLRTQTPLNRTWPPATWEPDFLKQAPPNGTPVERLQALTDLKNRGLITAAEFETQKKRILGGI
ncbi:MAG TPA: SHOCT domain-containing protein [Thermoleophilaceae bacterium]|nr:SHOCT domain-containing protein [Thermoleophilaceae bacterium]